MILGANGRANHPALCMTVLKNTEHHNIVLSRRLEVLGAGAFTK